MFLAAGASDHAIRMYYFGRETPEKMSELEGHSGIIDSIQFSNHSERFLSGSKDGTVRIWYLQKQEWNSLLLDMAQLLNESSAYVEDRYSKPKVLMLTWNISDSLVVTATSSYLLKVWDSHSGKLLHILPGHENDIYVLEPHPFDYRIMLSAGYDGKISIWDVTKGVRIKSYFNAIEGQGHGAILDCKLSADGQHIASTDSHGHLLIFGFGCTKRYEKIPDQMFFHTDYRPLCRDQHNWVLDEQTQQAPHLMPPPFLVDVDGNPHPPKYQRLVPGRENCADEHLVPQLGYVETSNGDVVEQVISQQTHYYQQNQDASVLDGMIRALQRSQEQRPGLEQEPGARGQPQMEEMPRRGFFSPANIGLRRSGQVEGIRQMHQNSPRSQIATERDLLAWKCRVVVPPIPCPVYMKQEEFRIAKGNEEKITFTKQRKYDFQDKKCDAPCLRYRSKPPSRMQSSRREVEEFIDFSCEEGEETEPSSENEASSENENEEEEAMDQVAEVSSVPDDDDWRSENDTGNSSSDYSDWTAEDRDYLQSPRPSSVRCKVKKHTSARRLIKKLSSSSDEESSADESSSETRTVKQDQNEAVGDPVRPPINGEISECRPPVWVTDTMPHRSPFVPQMGDEVIYFRQGHEAYINAVTRNNLPISNVLKEPWKKTVLRDQEVVKIVGIRYEVGPPVICCLKLTVIDHVSGKLTDQSFSLKYHDMPDVIDFLVLRQFYDHARQRHWQAGDKFRSVIDDAWWFGTVMSQEPHQADYPDSLFQCYTVKWDNTEIERLSPWDMDVIPIEVVPPEELGASISVSPDELDNLLYSPQEGEWGPETQHTECERIICGIDQLLRLDMATPFAGPVDLNTYPSYCTVVAYPTDLSTIRMRLVNRFYRRVCALKWEVKYIALNASTFNEPDSAIAKSAKKITELLLNFIMDSSCTDINDLINSTEGTEQCRSCDQMERPHTPEKTWQDQCMELVDLIIECEDSEPFREPVDLEQYTDYQDIVTTPMDFGTIKKSLADGKYRNPVQLCSDMRLVFSNAKIYTPNKRSRIYSMALRLSALVEDKMKVIISAYKLSQDSPQKSGSKYCNSKRQRTKPILKGSSAPGHLKQRKTRSLLENEPTLEPCSSQSTSSGVIPVSDQSNESVTSGSFRGSSPAKAATISAESSVTGSESDSEQNRSDSERESDLTSSSTSSSEHSTCSQSSDSSETETKKKPASRPKISHFKSKESNARKRRYATKNPASQGKKQKRNLPNKRKNTRYSDDSISSSKARKYNKESQKKILRKSAAVAANKIKCMSDVEGSVPSSDSDYSASKTSRTLPHRTAAAEAKKRLIGACELENGLRSDSDTEIPCQKKTDGFKKLESISNGSSSDNRSESDEEHSVSKKNVDQNMEEQSSSDSPCFLTPTSTQRNVVDTDSGMSSSDEDIQVSSKKIKLRRKRSDKRTIVRTRETHPTTSEECPESPRNIKAPSKPTRVNRQNIYTESDSESDIKIRPVHKRQTSRVSPLSSKVKVLYDSEGTSESQNEHNSFSKSSSSEEEVDKISTSLDSSSDSVSSFDDSSQSLHEKMNGKQPCGKVSKQKRKLRQSKTRCDYERKCLNDGKYESSSETSCDNSSEDMNRGKQKKRSAVICDDSDEDSAKHKKRSKTVHYDSEVMESRKSSKRSKSSDSEDSVKCRKRSKNSPDNDYEDTDCSTRKKLTRRSKICTRNQGKRTVRYNDEDSLVSMDENVRPRSSRQSYSQKVVSKSRVSQFFR
ncbi:bromodomain and WD repeat-containing 1 [Pelobates cultripes]|nr:bromodomain and WD repeat-containing 1 [Pelobates cultripes]